jgi:hypothetical protein
MKKLIFLGLIPVFLLLVQLPNVYASGPRHDYDEAYQELSGGPDCWVDGYDAGFSGQYDSKRARECYNLRDQYNRAWGYACRDGGHSLEHCANAINNPVDLGDHEQLDPILKRMCYDDGYEDGQNNPFDQKRNKGCEEYGNNYYKGFISGCIDTENTKETCEREGSER